MASPILNVLGQSSIDLTHDLTFLSPSGRIFLLTFEEEPL